MTVVELVVHVQAAIALAGISLRLAHMHRARTGWRSQAAWHGWVSAHVLLALGLLAELFSMRPWAGLLASAGLALYFGVQWHRRADDP